MTQPVFLYGLYRSLPHSYNKCAVRQSNDTSTETIELWLRSINYGRASEPRRGRLQKSLQFCTLNSWLWQQYLLFCICAVTVCPSRQRIWQSYGEWTADPKLNLQVWFKQSAVAWQGSNYNPKLLWGLSAMCPSTLQYACSTCHGFSVHYSALDKVY